MQFTWVFDRYDVNETLVGFWVRMLIYDTSFRPTALGAHHEENNERRGRA